MSNSDGITSQTSDVPKFNQRDISSIVGNMVLAHELIVNDDFQLTSFKDNTLEKAVKEIVHKAFWDNLQQQLNQNPPDFRNALHLLMEIKEILLSVLAPQNNSWKDQINEVLDIDLITQEVDHNCFDLRECARFIILVMGKLCAPVRDEEVKGLSTTEGIVPTLKGILEFLDVMKLDMANFQLQKLKPYLQTQCVDYERGKFKEFLEANPDGTTETKKWLKSGVEEIEALVASSFSHKNNQNHSSERTSNSHSKKKPEISPAIVLTHAYISLLNVDDGFVFPETLLMDELRLAEMRHMFDRLALIGSVMLITSNMIGQHLVTDSSFVKQLKDDLFILLDGVPMNELPSVLANISEQVASETKATIETRGLPHFTKEQSELLKQQIHRILDEKNSVYTLIRSRIRDFVLLCMTSDRSPKHNEAPLALAHVKEELKNLAGRFARLIIHNRNVYMPFYVEIVSSILAENGLSGESGNNDVCSATENGTEKDGNVP